MSYITFNSLGASGHLGSQIQTYTGLLAIAKAIAITRSPILLGGIEGFPFVSIGAGTKILDVRLQTQRVGPTVWSLSKTATARSKRGTGLGSSVGSQEGSCGEAVTGLHSPQSGTEASQKASLPD